MGGNPENEFLDGPDNAAEDIVGFVARNELRFVPFLPQTGEQLQEITTS